MRKLFVSIKKEALLLLRDKEGIALLFIMPVALVFIITLLQEKTYQNFQESNIPIVLLDADKDSVGIAFSKGIKEAGMFKVTEIHEDDSSSIAAIRDDVANGTYQMGIYIPPNTTKSIKNRVVSLVQQQMPDNIVTANANSEISSEIEIFFDPITKKSFRNTVKSSLNEFVAKIETQITFMTYSKVFDVMTNQTSNIQLPEEPAVMFEEISVSEIGDAGPPNSVQHNIPAWTLFAMFFVCIPLAGSIIKEREEGCMARLKTLPVSYFNFILAKSFVYTMICIVQAIVIILIGVFIFPYIGLPELTLGNSIMSLALITVTAAMASTSFGIMLGTFATSHVQASAVGAISVVLLAALGGVWIPVYVMSGTMRVLSGFSPMNWGIHGYYEYFLRNGNLVDIFPHVLKLFIFFVACISAAILRKKLRESQY